MTDKERVRAYLAAARSAENEDVGCSDHGCVFGHPGGMGTNGGCRCLEGLPTRGRRTVMRLLRPAALAEQFSEVSAEARRAGLEEAAKLCDLTRPHGGRAWTEEQAACFEALSHAAESIRSLMDKEKP